MIAWMFVVLGTVLGAVTYVLMGIGYARLLAEARGAPTGSWREEVASWPLSLVLTGIVDLVER